MIYMIPICSALLGQLPGLTQAVACALRYAEEANEALDGLEEHAHAIASKTLPPGSPSGPSPWPPGSPSSPSSPSPASLCRAGESAGASGGVSADMMMGGTRSPQQQQGGPTPHRVVGISHSHSDATAAGTIIDFALPPGGFDRAVEGRAVEGRVGQMRVG